MRVLAVAGLAIVVCGLSVSQAAAQGPTQVSLGSGFGCGLAEDGTVRCWGRNRSGQCGSEGHDARTPRPVTGLDGVREMGVGYGFACARREDGSVWCWGDNDHGQLGVEGDDRAQAMAVPGVSDVAQLAVGAFHVCVRFESGRVSCWGSNSQGVLRAPESVENRATPGPIRGIANATQLWSGAYHACVLDQRGRLKCWGASAHGQSGTRRRTRRAPPTRVRGIGEIAEISLGDGQSCARTTGGQIQCWGQNLYGAEEGVASFYSTPMTLPELSDVQSISVRSENQCAVAGGRVYCWGVNRMHQLHVPTTEAGQIVIHPSAVPGVSDATEVALGWFAQCVRHTSGRWSCWGRNQNGATGVGSNASMIETPQPLPW
jgi:alpha-tubulin suppressor-like RCC1 family protein